MPTGIFFEIFSSTMDTTEIILSQKLNLECSKSVKYKRRSLGGRLETTPVRVVWLYISSYDPTSKFQDLESGQK